MPADMDLEKYLYYAKRLKAIDMLLESNEGDYLMESAIDTNNSDSSISFKLVEQADDGSIPKRVLFSILGEGIKDLSRSRAVRALRMRYLDCYKEMIVKQKLTAGESEYLWPSDEGDTQVEFRSPVPGLPLDGELNVVIRNRRGFRKRKGTGGEYCLVACDDGTVKWLPESQCVNDNHVWTVRLFERRPGEVLYLRDQLQRPGPIVHNTYLTKNIGWNINESGTQTVGDVRCHYF